MKKILFVLVIVSAIFCSCSQDGTTKLEKKVKTEIKENAKLSGLSVKFNDVKIVKCDTIPTEVNGLYLKWRQNAEDNINLSLDNIKLARTFIGVDYDLVEEYDNKAESYYNLGLYWDSCATEEYENRHKPCYIVYTDYVLKGGAYPIRVSMIKMYKWQDCLNDFECCYTSTENPQKRFEKYKN